MVVVGAKVSLIQVYASAYLSGTYFSDASLLIIVKFVALQKLVGWGD